MTKHTPGPWRIDRCGREDDIFEIDAPSGHRIATVESSPAPSDDVAVDPYLDIATCEANAALIKAAPDLLDALEQIAGLSNAYAYDAPGIAREAIAKANQTAAASTGGGKAGHSGNG